MKNGAAGQSGKRQFPLGKCPPAAMPRRIFHKDSITLMEARVAVAKRRLLWLKTHNPENGR